MTPTSSAATNALAQFCFSVVGPLLAAPPKRGELQHLLDELAAKHWRHPNSGQWKRFGRSTIERWYYAALNETKDPVRVLQRKIRSDCGQHPSVSSKLREVLSAQYRAHPAWSYQLHFDNLKALATEHAILGSVPSYGTVRRFMQAHGLIKRRRLGPAHSPGALAAEHRFESHEVRSYQSEYVHALWHLDFHHGSLRVLQADGQWAYPLLLGVLDDRSRLACHAQWYLAEGAQELCHGLAQAFQKRALPRALMTDNGSAMLAAETQQGLLRLGIVHEPTLPYSPYQNGKQESFWGQIEGRLLPMLEGVVDLTLAQLNFSHPGLAGAGIQPQAAQRTGPDSSPGLSGHARGGPARSVQRGAPAGLYRRSGAHPTPQRWHLFPARAAPGSALTLCSLPKAAPALCELGSGPRPSGRSDKRRHPLPAFPAGQGAQRPRQTRAPSGNRATGPHTPAALRHGPFA